MSAWKQHSTQMRNEHNISHSFKGWSQMHGVRLFGPPKCERMVDVIDIALALRCYSMPAKMSIKQIAAKEDISLNKARDNKLAGKYKE